MFSSVFFFSTFVPIHIASPFGWLDSLRRPSSTSMNLTEGNVYSAEHCCLPTMIARRHQIPARVPCHFIITGNETRTITRFGPNVIHFSSAWKLQHFLQALWSWGSSSQSFTLEWLTGKSGFPDLFRSLFPLHLTWSCVSAACQVLC